MVAGLLGSRSYSQSMGHGSVLQGSWRFIRLGHSAPPYCGSTLTFFTCDCSPPPQDVEQSPSSTQSLTSNSYRCSHRQVYCIVPKLVLRSDGNYHQLPQNCPKVLPLYSIFLSIISKI